MVFFANDKTLSVAVDDKGKKRKAQGGQRVMYTTHHPCWDGKNRHNLPDELPFAFDSIAAAIQSRAQVLEASASVPAPATPVPPTVQKPPEEILNETLPPEPPVQEPHTGNSDFSGLPKALVQLMQENEVSTFEIQQAVSQKGYYPIDTPVENYDPGFINGVLVAAWPQVFAIIMGNRDLPFD